MNSLKVRITKQNPKTDKGRNFPMCVSALVNFGSEHKLDIQRMEGTFGTGINQGHAIFNLAANHKPKDQLEFYKSLLDF
jgi:hypothetical protein